MKKLSFKRALITGASSGIGAEFARQLAASGTNLVLVARRKERLEAFAGELKSRHPIEVEVLPADLANPADTNRVVQRIFELRDLDLLVNNAGFGTAKKFLESHQKIDELMTQVHVVALIMLSRAALQSMTLRKKGAIINVSSIAAYSPISGPLYSSTKSFQVMFSKNLASELRRTGVKVQALCPGFTSQTEFQEAAGIDKSAIPGFLWMTAERVVKTSLRCLRRNKVICIPGLRNKFFAFLMSCPLTSWLVDLAAKTKAVKKRSGRP